MVVREMLARDLDENHSGFYLWATKTAGIWNGDSTGKQAEWQMVHIPTVMSELVKEAQRGNRALRIMYRKDVSINHADSVQVI